MFICYITEVNHWCKEKTKQNKNKHTTVSQYDTCSQLLLHLFIYMLFTKSFIQTFPTGTSKWALPKKCFDLKTVRVKEYYLGKRLPANKRTVYVCVYV